MDASREVVHAGCRLCCQDGVGAAFGLNTFQYLIRLVGEKLFKWN